MFALDAKLVLLAIYRVVVGSHTRFTTCQRRQLVGSGCLALKIPSQSCQLYPISQDVFWVAASVKLLVYTVVCCGISSQSKYLCIHLNADSHMIDQQHSCSLEML